MLKYHCDLEDAKLNAQDGFPLQGIRNYWRKIADAWFRGRASSHLILLGEIFSTLLYASMVFQKHCQNIASYLAAVLLNVLEPC